MNNNTKSLKNYTIGIDVGGTKMTGVLFDGNKVLADLTLATPKDDLSHFLIMVKALIEPLEERAKKDKVKISGIGIGVPGILDLAGTKILRCANLSLLDGIKLGDELKNRFNYDVIVDNDANCFTLAEALLGAGKNFKNIYGLTLGTGIGGGWWINEKIYEGSHGSANEPGHMIVNLDQKMDIEDSYHKLTQNNPAQLAEEAYRGDILAEKAFEEVGNNIGAVIVNLIKLIDPEIIIIGGSVVESGDLFLNAVKKTIKEYIPRPEARQTKIVKSKLGSFSGAIGAALLITHNS